MKKILTVLTFLLLLLPAAAFAQFTTQQGGTGSTTPSGILYGLLGNLHLQTVTIGTGLSFLGGILSATGSSGGSTFGTSSLSAIYPIVYTQSPSLAQFSLAFGTTTSNIWAGTQTFTNSPVFSTLGAGTVNSTSAGTVYNTATTSLGVSSPLTVTGILGALIGGTNATINCQTASGSQAGCLSSADWNTFNGKQAAGNYITALTGDVTATGPGSVAATLATVNSNVGSFTNANITVNGKGLITAASNGTASSGGISDPFLHLTNFGVTMSATTTPVWFMGTPRSIEASSTIDTSGTTGGYQVDGLLFSTGSTTNQTTLTGFGALSALIKMATSSSNTSGQGATAFGYQALGNATSSAVQSTAVGYQALLGDTVITNGGGNTAVGYQALLVDTSGGANNAFGDQALLRLTTGNSNVAIGNGAMQRVTGGGNNMAIGGNAGAFLTTGNNDSFIGVNTGTNSTGAGASNTFIGAGAASNAGNTLSGNNNTSIGTFSSMVITGTAAQNTIIGSGGASNLTSGQANITIGSGSDVPLPTSNGQINIANILYGLNALNTTGHTFVPVQNPKMGVGSTSPFANLGVHANNGDTNTILFAIGSSTASATTTLFSIGNQGTITTALGTGCVQSASGVLSVTGACGSVTAVSVASANGFAGSSSGGATPALTLSTTITGLLKGNGTAISAAAYTDFPAIAAGTVLANGTGSSAAPTAISTSTLYGTCTGGQVVGWSNVIGGLTCIATSTSSGGGVTGTTGQVAYLSGTNTAIGTSTLFITPNGNVGVASTTPWGQLSVGIVENTLGTNPAFTVGSTTQTAFIIAKQPIAPLSGTTVIFLTSGTSWTVPNNWNNSNNKIEVIGAGGGGGGNERPGGGGGAYSKITNLTLTPGASISYQVGLGGTGAPFGTGPGTAGGDTYFNGTGSTCSAQSVCSKGGNGGDTTGTGGSSGSGVGTTKFSGGDASVNVTVSGGNGGGAAGLNGAGNNGSTAGTGTGGSGDAGFGGAGGAFGVSAPGGAGSAGTEYDASHGSGGGGGGYSGAGNDGGLGGNYGGGGGGGGLQQTGHAAGNGAPGLIVISYTLPFQAYSYYTGIGTTTPNSTLSVYSASNNPMFKISATISGIYYDTIEFIDKVGHLLTSGPTPTFGSCGTNPFFVGPANDRSMIFNVGSGVTTSCTINWSNAYPTNSSVPCQITEVSGGTSIVVDASTTPTGVVISGGTITSNRYQLTCQGAQ